MTRLLVILLFIPSLAFATFTEFYCQSGGSNLNSGSTTSNSAGYTKTNMNWNGSTIYTITDGTNPSASVSVGDWASVYLDAATNGVFISRVTAVQNANNGTITVSSTIKAGAAPSSGASGRSISVGGAWKGPNGASGFPLSLNTLGNLQNASLNTCRINMKNDATYSVTAQLTTGTSGNKPITVQGYTSTVGDLGRAIIDGGTSTGAIFNNSGTTGFTFADLILSTSITTGTTDLVFDGANGGLWLRCVFHGSRGVGLDQSGSGVNIECEAYDCNKANTASIGGFRFGNGTVSIRPYSHDHSAGSNGHGFVTSDHCTLIDPIADSNGGSNFLISSVTNPGVVVILNSDAYNATGDGINVASGITGGWLYVENGNLTKNGGKGINNVTGAAFPGLTYNLGYGTGTQANGASDTLGGIAQSGNVTYASNASPYTAPTTGNFSINLAAAQGAGRGAFTETDGTNTGTVGYPDIGAAQALPGCTFPTPTATPTATATSTSTPTNTPTPTPTATFTPTITPCAPTPTATATWTPTPTFTPTATATNTPTPTATATSTPTPTPTPSATSTPTATACAGGEVSYNHSD